MLLWHLWLILIKQLNDHFQWVMITVRGNCVRSGRATRACAMLWIIGGLCFLFILYDFFFRNVFSPWTIQSWCNQFLRN